MSTSASILYRFLRLALVDQPVAILHDLVRHEYFGHGGRGRLAGGTNARYRISLPPPYGSGSGSARLDFDPREFSDAEQAAFKAGGLEVSTLGLKELEERWVVTGRMDFRESADYLIATISKVGYIFDANGGPISPGHDVENYLYSLSGTGNRTVTAEDVDALKRRALVEVANFPLYIALVHVYWEYLVRGRQHVPAFRLPLAGAWVAPHLHLWLAPYGQEYALRLIASREHRSASIHIRKGAGVGAVAVGLSLRGVPMRALWSVDATVELWRQPVMAMTPGRHGDGTSIGLLAMAGFTRDVGLPVLLTGQLGIKSRGFVPGEPLSAGPLVRFGISWTR